MAGYTRNDTANNIADGNIINASDLDGEFDAVQSAFNASTGHTHDGTTGEGAPIEQVGPVQDLVITASEVKPKTTNTLDLGTSLLQYKDLYIDGSAYIDGLGESMLVDGSSSIQFRDSALAINSSTDGQLDIDADTELELTAPTVDINASTSVNISNDLKLDSDGAILSLGADGEVTLTHVHNTGLDLKNSSGFDLNLQTSDTTIESGNLIGKITFNAPDEAGGSDAIVVGASIEALAEDTFDSTTNSTAIVFKTNTSGAATERMRITSAGDLHFLDNRKAIFGAGSDLQIYHDGSQSYITDSGTGDLRIQGTDIRLRNAGETATYMTAVDGAEVSLRYNDGIKLATTNTGIDVTGTVTADGLTVESGIGNTALLGVSTDSGTEVLLADQVGGVSFKNVNGDIEFRVDGDASTAASTRLAQKIDSNGDISFYEDTGVTPKLVWDAADETLYLGDSTPGPAITTALLDINGTSYTPVTSGHDTGGILLKGGTIGDGNYTAGIGFSMNAGGANAGTAAIAGVQDSSSDDTIGLAFFTHDSTSSSADAAEAMRITSDGDVGIGTDSPDQLLHLAAGSGATLRFESTTTGATTGDIFGAIEFETQDANSAGVKAKIDAYSEGSLGNTALRFHTGDTTSLDEAMRIISSGQVGINTTNPTFGQSTPVSTYSPKLGVDGSVLIGNTSTTTTDRYELQFYRCDDEPGGAISTHDMGRISWYGSSNDNNNANLAYSIGVIPTGGTWTSSVNRRGHLTFNNYTTEVARLDSSGNLLVGTTATPGTLPTTTTDTGFATGSAGLTTIVRSDGTVIEANRLTSEGTIINLRKDGATIGSIGTNSASQLYIETPSQSGVTFANNHIYPSSGNNVNDADVSLGISTSRFKDLYLSGGLVLDDNPTAVTGSVTSKTLDYYEEGTFTPSVTSGMTGTISGRYIRIGTLVWAQFSFVSLAQGTATGVFTASLPFATTLPRASGSFGEQFGCVLSSGTTKTIVPVIESGVAKIFVFDNNGGTDLRVDVSAFNGDSLQFNITYQTTA